MDPRDGTVEAKLARLATREHGIVHRPELLATVVSATQIRRRLRKAAVIREFPGGDRVGHRAASVEAGFPAAGRACGNGGVLSGPAAGRVLGLLKGPAPRPE